jgi:TPR repeat protein/S1-C subfamily serine protease
MLDSALARILPMHRTRSLAVVPFLAALALASLTVSARADYDSGYKAFKNGDYKVAMDELLPLAKQGDPKAQRVVGNMYADGLGVDEDYAAAAKWYQLAVGQGYAAAMPDLGDLYYYGNGVDQDQAIALKWYRRGAERGDPVAEYDYGLIFHDGTAGQKQNFDAALKWFMRAAAQGDAPALNMVGYMHDVGEGVDEDPREAFSWYQRAADKDYDVAQYNLGVMYQNGRGVEKNPTLAAKWYRKAADKGDPDSQAALGDLYAQGLGVKTDVGEAIALYKAAARQGSSRALNSLGGLYRDGTGVPKNLVAAYVLYALAADKADNGDDRKAALDNRNDVAKGLNATDLAAAKTLREDASKDVNLVLPSASIASTNGDDSGTENGGGKKPKDESSGPDASTKTPDKPATAAPPQPGGPGNLVRSVKTALTALGYDAGGKDNALNSKTVAAIKAFQRDHGLSITGEISEDLMAALLAARFELTSASKTTDTSLGDAKLELYATGSGFYVSAAGHIVTNEHVVDGCKQMRLPDGTALDVIITDKANDLALLKAPKPGLSFVHFRDGHGVRTGEGILIAGFPLRDEISSEINVTTGNVSSLAGPNNDRTLIQITAPVQHGNSGGPVLDLSGNVVGVVQSKFDPSADTGDDNTIDVPQNVNFAVSAFTLRAFLDAQEVDYESAPSTATLSSADIAARAHGFTVSLECWQ